MDEGTFRRQFEFSGALLLAGLASDSFAAELGERYADAPTVGASDREGEEWG